MVSYQFTKQDKSPAAGPSQDEPLFTYKAFVTEVIDGDTFDAVVDLGFAISTKQKLRLRGLDAPEIVSTEGREAKAFLEKHFAKTHNEILIKTSKSDKYHRYLADVWAGEAYVNQALLDQGLAILVEN
jgi:micrococcal nuclease